MGHFTREEQVSFQSTSEVKQLIDDLVSEGKHHFKLKFRGRKFNRQHLFGALVIYLAALDEPTRRAILIDGMTKLDAMADPDTSSRPDADQPPPPPLSNPDSRPPTTPPKRSTRRGA